MPPRRDHAGRIAPIFDHFVKGLLLGSARGHVPEVDDDLRRDDDWLALVSTKTLANKTLTPDRSSGSGGVDG